MITRVRLVLALALTLLVASGPARASYTQQYTLSQDVTFQGQITVAVLSAAVQIMAETNTTAGHTPRVQFANVVLNNPTKYTPIFALVVAAQSANAMTPLTVPSTVADSLIQTAVNGVWNGLANYYTN